MVSPLGASYRLFQPLRTSAIIRLIWSGVFPGQWPRAAAWLAIASSRLPVGEPLELCTRIPERLTASIRTAQHMVPSCLLLIVACVRRRRNPWYLIDWGGSGRNEEARLPGGTDFSGSRTGLVSRAKPRHPVKVV